MTWWRRSTVEADVGPGFLARETAAHQSAIEATAGSGHTVTQVRLELTVHAEPTGAVVLAWHNRNVGFAPAEQAESLRGQVAAAGRARLVTGGEAFHDGGLWRVWVGPLPRPRDQAHPTDTVAPKPPTIAGIPLQRTDGPPPPPPT